MSGAGVSQFLARVGNARPGTAGPRGARHGRAMQCKAPQRIDSKPVERPKRPRCEACGRPLPRARAEEVVDDQ